MSHEITTRQLGDKADIIKYRSALFEAAKLATFMKHKPHAVTPADRARLLNILLDALKR